MKGRTTFESKIVLNQIDGKDGVNDIHDGSGSKYHLITYQITKSWQ